MISKLWDKYKNKQVTLIVMDDNRVRKRDGIFLDDDDTHVFLQTEFEEEPVGFLKTSIKRINLIK
jgi:hypothetical protein